MAARPPMTVVPVQPGLACAATPTGFSTTTMSSSAYTTARPSTGRASTTGGPAGAGSVTSSQSPALTLSDLGRGMPSTSASPDSATAAAAVRDSPNSREMAWSSRSPSRPSGTGTERRSATCGVWHSHRVVAVPGTGAVHPPPGQLEQHGETDPDAQRRVGHVEHRKALPVGVEDTDEVDDVPHERSGRPEDPVGEVPQGAAEHQPEGQPPRHRPQFARGPADPGHHGQGDQLLHERVQGAEAERRTAVAYQQKVDGTAQQAHRRLALKVADRQLLGDD